jgi:hypothetical protein
MTLGVRVIMIAVVMGVRVAMMIVVVMGMRVTMFVVISVRVPVPKRMWEYV